MAYELVRDEKESPSFGQELGRHATRIGTGVLSTAIGAPGDILSLVNEYVTKPATKAITGKEGLPYEETFLGKAIPTTAQHKKAFSQFTQGRTEPENQVEKFADDVIEDATSLLSPGGLVKGTVKLGSHVFKSLAKSLGANLVGEAAEQISGDKETSTYTKMGALFLGSLLDQKSTAKQIGDLYAQANSHIPPGALAHATKLENKLNALESSITKGRPISSLAPSEKFVIDEISKVRPLIQNGQILVEQAIPQKRSLNENLSKLYEAVPAKKDQQRARKLAGQINGMLSETIKDYGQTNPAFYKPYKSADQAFGTIAQSQWMARWAQKNIHQSPITHGLMHLVLGPVGVTVTAGAGGLALPYQAAKLMYRISKSPTLAKIYANTMGSAAKEDARAFNKYLSELDQKLQEEESKDKWEFVD